MKASVMETAEATVTHSRPKTEAYLRTDFLHALAHALRSPLSVVHGAVGELARGNNASKLHDMASRNLRRITHLAQQLDWVAELEAGEVELTREAVELRSLVTEALAAMDMGQVEVERVLPTDLPSISADGRLIKRALGCLLDNARRFARERVRIEVSVESDHLCLLLDDDGAGIDPERLDTVFDRFRSARERGADSDLALGLSIARDYLRLHDGSLELMPSPTGGLRCRVILPLDRVRTD